jgi:dihydroorotate dehydrogenase
MGALGYRRLARPMLFHVDPEVAHEMTMAALERGHTLLRLLAPELRVRDPRLEQRLMGLRFPNPVGLAPGFDKRARAVRAWPAVGFGFCEIGTVTAQPQPGNPRPRMFRLPDDRALINRLGFNNDGAVRTAARLRRAGRVGIPVGANIGKTRGVPLEEAPADLAVSLDRLWAHADYVVVNVSSPNTPGLRELQGRDRLEEILRALDDVNRRRASAAGRAPRPLLVKIDPDLAPTAVDEVVDLALERGLAGLVVANTTVRREGLASPPPLTEQAGGMSGRPLTERSTELVRRVARRAGGALVVVGVGGVFDADDAWRKLLAGASLVQVYTGLVYEGPTLPAAINRGLLARMAAAGAASLAEVVGQGARTPG